MIKTIHVTQEDIDNGRRRDPMSCPVANAIRRECNPYSIRVVPEMVIWGNMLNWGSAPKSRLPSHVGRRIIRYDGGIIMEPFEFDLNIPEEVECLNTL